MSNDVALVLCEAKRERCLFGQNQQACLVQNYYFAEGNSFVLPEITLVTISPKVTSSDLTATLANDRKVLQTQVEPSSVHHNSEFENIHGKALNQDQPSLHTLFVRELHRQACEYATGESDPCVFQ